MVAKHNLQIFRVCPIKVSCLTGNHLMDNHITRNLIQASLLAHKDNHYRENLRRLVVALLLTSGNLLVNQESLTLDKANLVPSKVTLLDKWVSLISSKANNCLAISTIWSVRLAFCSARSTHY